MNNILNSLFNLGILLIFAQDILENVFKNISLIAFTFIIQILGNYVVI